MQTAKSRKHINVSDTLFRQGCTVISMVGLIIMTFDATRHVTVKIIF